MGIAPPGVVTRLSPVERRRGSFVRERGHPGAEVVGAAAGGDRLRLELHLRLQALPRRLMEQALGAAERARRALRQVTRETMSGGCELPVGDDLRDEPPPVRLARRDR